MAWVIVIVYSSHGFRHVLLDLVDAPEAVLCYFCKYYYLHNIPIADRADIDRFVNSQNEILKFYVGYDVVQLFVCLFVCLFVYYCLLLLL